MKRNYLKFNLIFISGSSDFSNPGDGHKDTTELRNYRIICVWVYFLLLFYELVAVLCWRGEISNHSPPGFMKYAFSLSTLLPVLLLSITGCGKKDTLFQRYSELSSAMTAYEDRLNRVENLLAGTSEHLEGMSRRVQAGESLPPSDLKKFSHQVTDDYAEMAEEITELDAEFDALRTSIEAYFTQADSLVYQLRGNSIYGKARQDVLDKRKEFRIEYHKADSAMRELKGFHQDIQDMEKILELYTTLDKVSHTIERLRGLTSRAEEILTRLRGFKENGERIIGSQLMVS